MPVLTAEINRIMTDFIDNPQSSLPGVESTERLVASALACAVPTRLIAEIYNWDVRTIQGWGKDGIIVPVPNSAGLYMLGDVISRVDHWRLDIINKKQGEQGAEKNVLSKKRLEEQVRQLQLENDKLAGKLRDTDKVARVAFNRAKQVNDMMETAPSRLKSILAAETDEFAIGRILKEEFDRIRKENIQMVNSQW